MITLKADNRVLTTNGKYSYTVNNYASATATVYVTNTDGFAVNDYVLLGNFGSETAEILKVASVTAATGALTFKDELGGAVSTKYAHAESTKVTVVPYNQVRFFWNPTNTWTGATPLAAAQNIQASDWFTTYQDDTNQTGFGFFAFFNVQTGIYSSPSNSIPYGGFSYNNVKSVFDAFYSLLNNKELKLITTDETFLWMNEGYSIMRNQLNLINTEYGASVMQTLNVVAGTQEYLLPTDFADLLSITDNQRLPIEFIKIGAVPTYSQGVTKYYLRGKYIGFAPPPAADVTYTYQYVVGAPRLTSYDEEIDLPNSAFYLLKDYMIFRAHQKLRYPDAANDYKLFQEALNRMKVDAIKRSANQDSWEPAPYANV